MSFLGKAILFLETPVKFYSWFRVVSEHSFWCRVSVKSSISTFKSEASHYKYETIGPPARR